MAIGCRLDQRSNPAPVDFAFVIWFVSATSLYVCDKSDDTARAGGSSLWRDIRTWK
jgi:hypothetical protein